MRKVISTPDAIPPMKVFSQAIVSGDKVFVSGSVGCTKDWVLVEGGIQPQTRAALQNMKTVLEAAGSGLEHVVKANIYMTNMKEEFPAMNEVYAEFFPKDPPARTCVGVMALPLGATMEIECIAELP